MQRIDLTQYDIKPEALINYMRYNGPHFTGKLAKFAIKKMTKLRNGKQIPIQPISKEELDNLLERYNIKLENNQLHDYVYVANMCKADFLGSSITDEEHLVKYVKDVIDDDDAYDGIVFNRWYADMCRKGIAIDWEEML